MKPCELRWRTSFSASCIHAADVIARGWRIVDPRLQEALIRPAEALRDEIRLAGLPEARFWRVLNAYSSQLDNNRELAARALRLTVGAVAQQESLTARLAGRIAEIEAAVQQALPRLAEELQLRVRPLREQWEGYGPGLLQSTARLTDERLLVESADVVLVHPVMGGDGSAHLSNNSVCLEAVLTNNIPQLPEILRLAWLVMQLNQDLPMFSELVHADRLPMVSSLAMLPAVLQAGSELGICQFDPATVAVAVSAWHIDAPSPDAAASTASLWWETYCSSPTPWATGLSALDRMMEAGEDGER